MMLGLFNRISGRRKCAAQDALPPSIEAILAGFSAHVRSVSSEDGKARVLLMHHASAPPVAIDHGHDTRDHVRKWWPELNDQQIQRAVTALEGKARQAIERADQRPASRRARWSDWRPLDFDHSNP